MTLNSDPFTTSPQEQDYHHNNDHNRHNCQSEPSPSSRLRTPTVNRPLPSSNTNRPLSFYDNLVTSNANPPLNHGSTVNSQYYPEVTSTRVNPNSYDGNAVVDLITREFPPAAPPVKPALKCRPARGRVVPTATGRIIADDNDLSTVQQQQQQQHSSARCGGEAQVAPSATVSPRDTPVAAVGSVSSRPKTSVDQQQSPGSHSAIDSVLDNYGGRCDTMSVDKSPLGDGANTHNNNNNGGNNNSSDKQSTGSGGGRHSVCFAPAQQGTNDGSEALGVVPTQEYLLKTTVPQAIITSKLAERHTPTRNSLRHSRMIGMHNGLKVPRKSLPPIIRFLKLAKTLVALQTALGVALCLLSLWLLFWTPTLRTRDNAYWSAIPLLLSGICGLVLLCYFKKEYPRMPGGYCVYSIKVVSVFLATVAGATCLTAATFALLHTVTLASMECQLSRPLNDTCVCQLAAATNRTVINSDLLMLLGHPKHVHYADLTCNEIDVGLWPIVITSAVVNAVGGALALWYVYLHWASRYYNAYSPVRTRELRPIVIQNT